MPKNNDNKHHIKKKPLLQALCHQQLKQCRRAPEKYPMHKKLIVRVTQKTKIWWCKIKETDDPDYSAEGLKI
jgi:hypothetical protein